MLRTPAPLIGALGLINMTTQKMRRRQERFFSAHNAYLRIARIEFEKAKEKTPGWFNSAFITITFSALAIEAICNAVGHLVDPDWELRERDSPIDKLEHLAKLQGIPHSWKSEPWKTIRWLCKLRNKLAHAKPERISTEKIFVQGPKANETSSMPDAKLEKEITIGKAKRAFDAVENLKDILAITVPVEQRLGLYSDGWTTSTQVHHEA